MSNIRTSHEDCEYCKKLWSAEPFNHCYRRGGRETDIDLSVENGGHFLHTEGKSDGRLRLEDLKRGQRLYWEARLRTGLDTLVIVNGTPPTDVAEWRSYGEFEDAGYDLVSLIVFKRNWFQAVGG